MAHATNPDVAVVTDAQQPAEKDGDDGASNPPEGASSIVSHSTAAVVERTLERIARYAGVYGYLVVHYRTGALQRHAGFEKNVDIARNYARTLFQFAQLALSTLRTMDGENDLTFLRMRWRHRDVLIAPDYTNREYVLIVIQNVGVDAEQPSTAAAAAAAGVDRHAGTLGSRGGEYQTSGGKNNLAGNAQQQQQPQEAMAYHSGQALESDVGGQGEPDAVDSPSHAAGLPAASQGDTNDSLPPAA